MKKLNPRQEEAALVICYGLMCLTSAVSLLRPRRDSIFFVGMLAMSGGLAILKFKRWKMLGQSDR
ncbi:MAG: hypothetical protein JST51_13595 [Armatimonadetes bacterium]|nr:hypothetical protein [Armatimonadota bacterium]